MKARPDAATLEQPPASNVMTLANNASESAVAADWIGKFFMLGRLTERWARKRSANQLVVILSLPVRDFAAVLVACGWATATPTPLATDVHALLVELPVGTPVRVVSKNRVFTARFGGIDQRGFAQLGSKWQIDKLQAVATIDTVDEWCSQPLPVPGVISQLANVADDWASRLCTPAQDLAIVGTMTRINEELSAQLGRGDAREPIANILLPNSGRDATWSTWVMNPTRLEERDLDHRIRAAILDGTPATRHLPNIQASVVVSIVDRSVSDETMSEFLVNYRNNRGDPVSLKHDLHWTPPIGVEALAFEVPL